jgi:hypothetical protein
MNSQSISGEESIFREQPPNLRQHSGVVNDSQRIFQIDYAPYLNRWFSRRTANPNAETDQKLVLVNVYDPQNMITYEWCRPDLQAIIAGENLLIIRKLLKEDILNYLR